MKEIARLMLLCLLCAHPAAWPGETAGDRVDVAESVSVPDLIRVSMADFARLRYNAGLRVRSLAGRESDEGTLIDAIRAEVDPVLREAQWSAWLDSIAVSGELKPLERQALKGFGNATPIVGIPHHEFPSRTIPAFALAARADALLVRHAQLTRARDLANRPDELSNALESGVDSPEFAAGLQALEFVSPALLADVVQSHLKFEMGAGDAPMILLKAAELAPDHWKPLAGIVRRGNAGTARRALVLAMERAVPQLPEIAAAALARSELGGLALTAAKQSGRHPDEFCWPLLGDPAIGADAARMLAKSSNRLLPEISARIHQADGLARLRMLLALRLRGSDASRQMLGDLVEAPWLSEQQRREVRSWL